MALFSCWFALLLFIFWRFYMEILPTFSCRPVVLCVLRNIRTTRVSKFFEWLSRIDKKEKKMKIMLIIIIMIIVIGQFAGSVAVAW